MWKTRVVGDVVDAGELSGLIERGHGAQLVGRRPVNRRTNHCRLWFDNDVISFVLY